jgi:hypothetical protein
MAYRASMPKLLRDVGWEVLEDEFTEIEDPDPDNHGARQRQLIRDIEDARKDAQSKPEKRKFGLFKRGKLAKKKGWETYDGRSTEEPESKDADKRGIKDDRVLFDIDAIRAELESEQMEVRQLESTLPPMKLDLSGSMPSSVKIPQAEFPELRTTKSHDGVNFPTRSKTEYSISPLASSNGYPDENKDANDHHEEFPGSGEVTISFEPEAPFPSSMLSPQHPSESLEDVHSLPLKPTATMPKSLSTNYLEHNAWAGDDEYEEFGGDQEVKMIFE